MGLHERIEKLERELHALKSGHAWVRDEGSAVYLDGVQAQYAAAEFDDEGQEISIAWFTRHYDADLFVKALNAKAQKP